MNTNSAVSVHTAPPHGWVLIVVLVKLVHLVLSVVEVVEQNPDDATSNERRNSKTSKHPLDLGVDNERVECLRNSRSESVGKEVHGLNERLHAGRGFGVCVLETSDRCEDLRETDEHVSTSLSGNVNVVSLVNAIDEISVTRTGVRVARPGLVNVVLDDASVDHGERGDPESGYDTVDRRERNLVLAERGHEPLVNDGQENDNGDGIEVLHQVVGNTVATHLTGLSDEVVGEVAVNNPVDWVESEDLASDESALNFIDKVVVPVENLGLAHAGLVGRLSSVHLAVLDHQPDDAESISNDGSLRRSDNVDLATEDEDEQSNEEDAEAKQVGGPEINVTLHVGGGEQRQRSGVNAPVEDHVNPLDSNGRIDDNFFASLVVMANDHLPPLVLVGNQGSNVGLDTTSSKTNDNDGNDETTESSAVVESSRDRCAGKDDKTDDVDTAEDDNGVVLSKVLIGNDGTENGSDVAPELEEGGETSGSLVAHTERTTTF